MSAAAELLLEARTGHALEALRHLGDAANSLHAASAPAYMVDLVRRAIERVDQWQHVRVNP